MADLINYKAFKNTRFEVLTDDGFKDFEGIIVGENKNKLIITFNKGVKLICTPKHKVMVDKNNYKYAEDLQVNDNVYNNFRVVSIRNIESDDLVYELLDVKDSHKYYTNDILSHQCLIIDEMAFIECISGESVINVRNKKTGEKKQINIEDFFTVQKLNNL